jgi:hypothetical protein
MVKIIFLLLALEAVLFTLNWIEFVERRGKDD